MRFVLKGFSWQFICRAAGSAAALRVWRGPSPRRSGFVHAGGWNRALQVWLWVIPLLCAASSKEEVLTDDGFRLALPGYKYSFPRDHASHPKFRTEWWYFTGHLAVKGDAEPSLGYELTFFRTGLQVKSRTTKSAWGLRDLHFAHFAISDLRKKKFWFAEKVGRGAIGLAGAEPTSLHTWIENWSLEPLSGAAWRLRAGAEGRSIDLQLVATKPEVIHGEGGVSQKAVGPGKATHYVSSTRMRTTGSVHLGDRALEVVGETWHDHEFGSNSLGKDQVGWDWFSLQFASGEELMIYLLRKRDGCYEITSSGTWVDREGRATHLGLDKISVLQTSNWKSPTTGAVYPSKWEIRVPSQHVEVFLEPLLADQELIMKEPAKMAYWEGACKVSGSHSGRAYVEMTGYDGADAAKGR